jgi:acetylornithine/N-succinyldiaminopimelate aminotransferase
MLLEDQLPRIQKLIKEKIGPLPANALQNEAVMQAAFRRLYQALPRMIRLAVSEQGFVEFCMANRERLLNLGDAVSEKFSAAKNADTTGSEAQSVQKAELEQNENHTTAEMLATAQRVFLPTYAPSLILSRSQGAKVWDRDGKEYIDFGAGISVNSLGHQDPGLLQALTEQSGKLWHTTNLYLTEPAIKLAENLVDATFADRVFFCNSGAEANEAAIKLARKSSSLLHAPEKREILTFEGSFHGRTLATVTATAQPKYQQGFEPLPGGFRYCPFNDFEAATAMIGANTCAVMVEPVQGEGGVNPAKSGFLLHLRKLCDQNNALLIFDEIQSGMGRTGKLFGYQWEETASEVSPETAETPESSEQKLIPDIVTMAKALGGGLPIGAMLCTEKLAQSFKPGDHGTTFGGNPIVTAVAGAAFGKINTPEMLTGVLNKGAFIRKHLESLNDELSLFETIRGRGLMIGAVLSKAWKNKAPAMVTACQQQGVLVLIAGPGVLRFLPPLNIAEEELKIGLERVGQALKYIHSEELASGSQSE